MKDVLFITVDSLRVDHVGCYGYGRETTPKIDSIAESSHVFENAFAHAGATRASFPSILTSSYPSMFGGYQKITEDRVVVAEVLKNEGYQTAGFHSNPYLNFGYNRGFDEFYDPIDDDPSTFAKIRQLAQKRLEKDGILFKSLKKMFSITERKAGIEVGGSYEKASEITDMAVEWIESTDSSSPSFLWTHYMDVHHPYTPPEDHQLEFRDSPISEKRAIHLRRKMLESPTSITDEELEEIIDLYDAEIRYTDAQIGRLVESAREKFGNNVAIIITADHGEEFLDHGSFSHGSCYEENLHIPLIYHNNDVREENSSIQDELVGLMDIAPTIVDCAGGSIPEDFFGYNIHHLLAGKDWKRTSVLNRWEDSEGKKEFYRDKKWKYIHYMGEAELYDIQKDPQEENPIENYGDVVTQLEGRIEELTNVIEKTAVESEDVEIDTRTEQRLENLGYK